MTPHVRGRLFGLSFAHLLNDGASNYLPGVLPAVLVSLNEPVRMAGVLVAALTIGQALQPITGWIADHVGGRSLVVLGLLFSSVGGGLIGVAHTTWILILLLLMVGTGGAMFHPQALAGVRSLLSGQQGFLTSVFLVGGELGRGIWPTAASLVVANLGLRSLWIVGLPGLLMVPFLLRLAPRLPARPTASRSIQWRDHARPMTVLIGYRSVRALTIYALVTFIPITWHLRGGSLVAGASIITAMLGVGVIGNLWGGHLADRLGRMPVLLVSAVAVSVLVLPVIYLRGTWVWVAASLLGIALFLTASPAILIGQDIFPENRSMGSGIALGLANGIGAVMVLLIGLLVSDDNITFVFWVISGLGLASALLALLFPPWLMHEQTTRSAPADQA